MTINSAAAAPPTRHPALDLLDRYAGVLRADTGVMLASEWSDIAARRARLDAEATRKAAKLATHEQQLAKLQATAPLVCQREADFKGLADQRFVAGHAGQDRTRERIEIERDIATQTTRIMPVARDQVGATALVASAAVLRAANTLPWKLWTMRDAIWLDDEAPIAAPRITDAVMLGQAHSLVSAMAAFGATEQAVLDIDRQTALPVHRTEPMWGVPALTP